MYSMDMLKQTCSTGVSAQCSRPLQGGHRRAHPLHGRQLAVVDAGGPGAGDGGVLKPGRGRGES